MKIKTALLAAALLAGCGDDSPKNIQDTSRDITKVSETKDEFAPEIILPSTLYSVAGKEVSLYYDNAIMQDGKDFVWRTSASASSGTMQNLNERFKWVPAGAVTSGNLTVEAIGKNSGAVLSSKTIALRSAASSAGSGLTKKVIVIGDSLINAGAITHTLLDLAAADVMGVALYGTRGSGSNKHEGRPGWSIPDYTGPGRTAEVPPNPNPFWINGVLDFSGYLQANSIPTPDWVIIQLGINDVFGQDSDAAAVALAQSYFNLLDGLISSIKAAAPGTKVALMIPSPPSYDQDSFGLSEALNTTRYRFKRNILLWARELVTKYSGQEASRVYIVPSNLSLDVVNNMSRTDVAPVNSRSSVTVARQSNGVHPAAEGYRQLGDALWAFLKYYADGPDH